MKFTLSYARALLGYNIDVQINAEDGEEIGQVSVLLDGSELSDETLPTPSVSYQRTYLQVGTFSPHADHTLEVLATDGKGNQRTAIREWQDAS